MKPAIAIALFSVALVGMVIDIQTEDYSSLVVSCEEPPASILPDGWPTWFDNAADVTIRHIPVPDFTVGGREQISHLQNNQLFIDESGPLLDLADVDWSDESLGSQYATQLHTLAGVGAALNAGEKLPVEVENAIGHHIIDWAGCAGKYPQINSRAWLDQTVTSRQANLLLALYYTDQWGQLGELSTSELLYLIEINSGHLLDDPDIQSSGTQRISREMLLAATALAVPEQPRADEMLNVAEDRLNRAADMLFSKEGIWLEHAPGYVNNALRLMLEVRQLTEESPQFSPDRFLANYDASLEFLLSSLSPDGIIPSIGVSNAMRIAAATVPGAEIDAQLKARENSLRSYPDYGHAIIRGDHPDGLYLLFVAGQHLPAGRRHSDELSFLLYNHGRSWITEGGHSGTRMETMSQYLQSPFAHNTYTLNGEQVGPSERPDLDVSLLEATENGDRVILRGESERFVDDARFEREVEVVGYQDVTIRDHLEGQGKWEGQLQLPGDLTVTLGDNTITAHDADGKEMVISFQSDAELSFSQCRGETDPICGWTNTARELRPATTITWSFQGPAHVDFAITWSEQ
jgi:hypothetical protein